MTEWLLSATRVAQTRPPVIPGTAGTLHRGTPRHPAANAHRAATGVSAAARTASAAHHHAVAPALLPDQHPHLGGNRQSRRRGLEQDAVQPPEHAPEGKRLPFIAQNAPFDDIADAIEAHLNGEMQETS